MSDSTAPMNRTTLITRATQKRTASVDERTISLRIQRAGMRTAIITPIVPPMKPKYMVTCWKTMLTIHVLPTIIQFIFFVFSGVLSMSKASYESYRAVNTCKGNAKNIAMANISFPSNNGGVGIEMTMREAIGTISRCCESSK